ncbi:hypothetical protein C1S70_25820 [Azospirillum argentinense]|uniref:Uncharacterized protein n=2 Tax=Azospirillum TaxID=191 RepID=A0A2K1FUB3_9PROT|nr:hypothetical protein C1S70_25820 [Azospirillum argentinense]
MKSIPSMTSTLNVCALALTCALVPAILTAAPAAANEKPAGGGCPWAQDVKLDLNGKTLTLNQEAFSAKGEPLDLEGYQIFPLLDQLKLRILGPRGQEWEAGLTRLSGGKRCQAFYVGKPFQVSDETGDRNSLILVR